MTGHVSRHYLFRMAVMLVIVSGALSLPVVLAHLIPYIGPVIHRGLPMGLLFAVIPWIIPMVLYLAIPVFVAIVIVRFYDQKIHANEVSALMSAGVSKFRLALPGISLSVFAMALCYVLSFYVVPESWRQAHNLKFVAKRDVSYQMISEGRFMQIKRGIMIHVERWRTRSEVEGIYVIDQTEPALWRIIVAKRGIFSEQNDNLVLEMTNGRIDHLKDGRKVVQSVVFQRFSHTLATNGLEKRRGWESAHEQSMTALFNPPAKVRTDSTKSFRWQRELVKRIAAPFLCLSYGLFCLGVILLTVNPRRNSRRIYWVAGITVGSLHLGFFFLIQILQLPLSVIIPILSIFTLLPFLAGAVMIFRADHPPSTA